MRRRSFLSLLSLLASLGVLVACSSSSTAPASPSVAGTWTGATSTPARTLTITLTQTGTTVTGSGVLTNAPSADRTEVVSGTFVNPGFLAVFTSSPVETIDFHGTLDGRTITGTLSGFGFNATPVVLTRQP